MYRKRRGSSVNITLVFAIIIVVIITFISKDSLQRHFIYPDHYQEEIIAAAEVNEMDPNLLFAVVRAESRFDETAQSAVGAQGLMQLMPETASWICQKAEFTYDSEIAVWDAAANVMMGAWYLNWLSETYYGGNIAAAIAAYNAGQQNVNTWLIQGVWDGSFKNADDIPFGETAAFLQKVNKSRKKYVELYDFGIITTGKKDTIIE